MTTMPQTVLSHSGAPLDEDRLAWLALVLAPGLGPKRILDAVKQIWGDRVTTVFPLQGRYALDPAETAAHPAPDITIAGIGDLLKHDRSALLRS